MLIMQINNEISPLTRSPNLIIETRKVVNDIAAIARNISTAGLTLDELRCNTFYLRNFSINMLMKSYTFDAFNKFYAAPNANGHKQNDSNKKYDGIYKYQKTTFI